MTTNTRHEQLTTEIPHSVMTGTAAPLLALSAHLFSALTFFDILQFDRPCEHGSIPSRRAAPH